MLRARYPGVPGPLRHPPGQQPTTQRQPRNANNALPGQSSGDWNKPSSTASHWQSTSTPGSYATSTHYSRNTQQTGAIFGALAEDASTVAAKGVSDSVVIALVVVVCVMGIGYLAMAGFYFVSRRRRAAREGEPLLTLCSFFFSVAGHIQWTDINMHDRVASNRRSDSLTKIAFAPFHGARSAMSNVHGIRLSSDDASVPIPSIAFPPPGGAKLPASDATYPYLPGEAAR
ncbi:hypothetical protein NUW54_g7170 [Trametes sanguinea]|uniref:Uncharacterized protein n=1 Tax=Trametes sanguinea TaxID=158606 RepID=A0ACC1PNI0_9APHY|nr:hypothetical protein NUW54_g7170 [Trametes sanguinea]